MRGFLRLHPSPGGGRAAGALILGRGSRGGVSDPALIGLFRYPAAPLPLPPLSSFQAAKAIERHAAQLCVLAQSCDQPDYTKLARCCSFFFSPSSSFLYTLLSPPLR